MGPESNIDVGYLVSVTIQTVGSILTLVAAVVVARLFRTLSAKARGEAIKELGQQGELGAIAAIRELSQGLQPAKKPDEPGVPETQPEPPAGVVIRGRL